VTIKNQPILEPKITDALQALRTDIFRSLNCVKIGKIVAFNVTKKTADVQVNFKRMLPDGTLKSYPLLRDCPVFTLQGGGASIRFPITAGDQCLLVFSDRNIDAWFTTGGEGVPYDARFHDLSDGIALVGLDSLTSTLAAYKTDEAVMDYLGAQFSLKGGKLAVANVTTDLLTAIELLIDTVSAVTTATGTPLSGASIAALAAVKATFEALLYVPL
jgi:hypothetical protein